MAATYLINKFPSSILRWKIQSKIMYQYKCRYEHLRFIGCLCDAYNKDRGRNKLDARSRRCIFIGYPYLKKGYKVYDLGTQTSFVSIQARREGCARCSFAQGPNFFKKMVYFGGPKRKSSPLFFFLPTLHYSRFFLRITLHCSGH